MARYEVWASNDPFQWTHCLLETDDREEAKERAAKTVDGLRFSWVAIDEGGVTIWSNDPDTPATFD